MKQKNKARTCPICKSEYTSAPSLSRMDNQTYICPDCGARQALDIFALSDAEKDEVIRIIHQNRKN